MAVVLALIAGSALAVASDKDCQDNLNCGSSWLTADKKKLNRIYAFAEDYKAFIAKARTELSFVE